MNVLNAISYIYMWVLLGLLALGLIFLVYSVGSAISMINEANKDKKPQEGKGKMTKPDFTEKAEHTCKSIKHCLNDFQRSVFQGHVQAALEQAYLDGLNDGRGTITAEPGTQLWGAGGTQKLKHLGTYKPGGEEEK